MKDQREIDLFLRATDQASQLYLEQREPGIFYADSATGGLPEDLECCARELVTHAPQMRAWLAVALEELDAQAPIDDRATRYLFGTDPERLEGFAESRQEAIRWARAVHEEELHQHLEGEEPSTVFTAKAVPLKASQMLPRCLSNWLLDLIDDADYEWGDGAWEAIPWQHVAAPRPNHARLWQVQELSDEEKELRIQRIKAHEDLRERLVCLLDDWATRWDLYPDWYEIVDLQEHGAQR